MADIRHSISIDALRERVFPLIASGSGFSRWWAADVLEDYSTGIIEARFYNPATVYRLKPIQNSTSWTTEWMCQTGEEWTGTRLLFELKETSGKTELRFTHADWKAETDYFVSCRKTWEDLMLRLKAAAEGGGLGPLFSKNVLGS
ncbi:MAG: SRPBCC domain-containing protein [Candidatus Pacebacteria bacterium]|nr:SRPBCC domain-containing protein [Candidatus Paceibacterota bacterium]